MRAAVYAGNRKFDVKDIPTPEPGPNQVQLQVKYSAICGTDVHAFLYDQVPAGIVLGHEYCGSIASVGSDVTGWKVGDRVIGGGGTPPPGTGLAFATDPTLQVPRGRLHRAPPEGLRRVRHHGRAGSRC